MRKHIMLVCTVLGICCARLPRQGLAPPGRARWEAGAPAAAGAGVCEGRVGSEERGAPECCGVSLHVTKFGGVT